MKWPKDVRALCTCIVLILISKKTLGFYQNQDLPLFASKNLMYRSS
jgi:hypothetical protein